VCAFQVSEPLLDFFIVDLVLGALKQEKGAGAIDSFVKFGALLVSAAPADLLDIF
jgi:hypothetical protein